MQLTFCNSESIKSKPGIPLDAPLGPLLTYFSVVVVIVRVGEMPLKLNRWIFPLRDASHVCHVFEVEKFHRFTHLPSETTLVGFAATRYSTWGESALPPRLGVALLETLVCRSSRRASKIMECVNPSFFVLWTRRVCTVAAYWVYWDMRENFFMNIFWTFRNCMHWKFM